jgi:hypothetical protein
MSADDFADLSPPSRRQPPARPSPLVPALVLGAIALAVVVVGWLVLANFANAPPKPPALASGVFNGKAAEFRDRMRGFIDDAKALARSFDERPIVKLLEDKIVALGETLSRVPEPPAGGERIREKAKRVNDILYQAVDWARHGVAARLNDNPAAEKKANEEALAAVAKARKEIAEIEALLK